jgi:WD40 repeat protein
MDQYQATFLGGPPPKVPDHELLRPIGRGGYGEVWLARSMTGSFHAVKIVYRRNFESDEPFEREFNGVKNFEPICRSHEGLLDILQVGRNEAEDYFYSVMEIADSRDGNRDINPDTYEPLTMAVTVGSRKPLSYDECLEFGLRVSSALAYLHKRGLVHRDIKPSNIIVVNGLPKLADIGMVTEADSASIAGGTLGYLAPEGRPSPQADVYSFGKVLYEISTGKDRMEHPALPEFWNEAPNLTQLAELNEVVLKACEADLTKRYESAEQLHHDFVLLESGESVKRLHSLERLFATAKRASVVAVAIALLALGEFYRVYRQREDKSMRLADTYAAAGARQAAQGDFLGALPWYVQALQLDQFRGRRAERHRMNIDAAIRYSPRKVRMFFETNDVKDVRFSPSGDQIVEALANGRIVVRNLDAGDVAYTLRHTNEVRSASWSPNGLFIVSASADSTARVWNTKTLDPVAVILTNAGPLFCAEFNSQGNRVVTGGKTADTNDARGIVQLWNWEDQKKLSEQEFDGAIRTCGFNADGSLVVVGGEAGGEVGEDMTAAYIREAMPPTLSKNTRLPHPPKAGAGEPTWIYGARFSPTGRFLATAGFDGLVRIWDLKTSQTFYSLPHNDAVRSVEFSPDSRYVLTACNDYTARLWDIERQAEVIPPLWHSSFVVKASFSPDGRLIATATTGGIITIWDLAPSQWEPPKPTFYSLDGTHFVQVVASNSVQVVELRREPPLTNAFSCGGTIRDVKLTPTGNRLLVLTESDTTSNASPLSAQLYETDGKRAGARFAVLGFVPEEPTHFIAGISSNGYRVALVKGTNVECWDAEHGNVICTVTNATDAGAALSLDGRRMVTYSQTNAWLFDGWNGPRICPLPHQHNIESAEFRPDGQRFVTACRDDDEASRSAYIWKADTGALVSEFAHADGVSSARFSSDNCFLLTAGEDHVVNQWRVDNDRTNLVRRFRYSQPFRSASFNSNASRVVTVAGDSTICVWDAESGELIGVPLTPPLKQFFNVWDARFIGDGNSILAKRLGNDRGTRLPPKSGRTATWTHEMSPRSPMLWEQSILSLSTGSSDLKHLQDLSRLLSAKVFEANEPSVISNGDLQQLWRKTQRTKMREFNFFPDEIAAWHRRQADEAERHEDAFAALFHVNRLALLANAPPELIERRKHLQTILKKSEPTASE